MRFTIHNSFFLFLTKQAVSKTKNFMEANQIENNNNVLTTSFLFLVFFFENYLFWLLQISDHFLKKYSRSFCFVLCVFFLFCFHFWCYLSIYAKKRIVIIGNSLDILVFENTFLLFWFFFCLFSLFKSN